MKKNLKNQIVLILILTNLVLFSAYFYKSKEGASSNSIENHIVVLTKNGFEPKNLEINEGDSVTFKSDLQKDFFPASDPHPIHNAYKGFEPSKAIQPNEEWSFTFNLPGAWAFHDHLDVSHNGVIIVKNRNISLSKNNTSICDKVSVNSSACFDEELRKAVRDSGINSAFEMLSKQYDTGNIKTACHWSAHKIGEEAYSEEEKGRPLLLTNQTYYCGYGFFHGYLEVMLRKNPYPDKQKEKVIAFCDAAQKQIGGEARDNCYHGIGSGFTENPPDPKVWGKPDELVQPGLDICEKLFANTREWEMCTTGVFAVLANFLSEKSYEFEFDLKDPFKFCADLPKKFHRACYGELSAKINSLTKNNLRLVPDYIKNVDINIAKLIVDIAAVTIMQDAVLQDDQTNFISDCRLFSAELQPLCIDGIVWGFLYHGKINEEHVKAIKFCNSNLFNSQEKELCNQRLIARAKNMYSAAKFDKICSLIDEKYRHYCGKNLPVQLYE